MLEVRTGQQKKMVLLQRFASFDVKCFSAIAMKPGWKSLNIHQTTQICLKR